jgi:hypothetical protein
LNAGYLDWCARVSLWVIALNYSTPQSTSLKLFDCLLYKLDAVANEHPALTLTVCFHHHVSRYDRFTE